MEKIWYGIKLAGWAIDRAREQVKAEAVDSQLNQAHLDLQQANEQLGNIVVGLPAEERPREDVLARLHRCLIETHEF